MDVFDYLRGLRRRWSVIVANVVLALTAGWLTLSIAPPQSANQISSYNATTLILSLSGSSSSSSFAIDNLNTVATLMTTSDVPLRVAKAIDYEGSPLDLTSGMQALADETTGLLNITATSDDPAEATQLSNAFARELIGWVEDAQGRLASQAARGVGRIVDDLRVEIDSLRADVGTALPSEQEILQSELDAKIGQFQILTQQFQTLTAAATAPVGLQIVQKGTPVPTASLASEDLQPPQSRAGRLIFAGILGLLAGIALALVMERLNTRIRTREDAEAHFGEPVIAEIPTVSTRKGGSEILAATQPRSPAADAFRLLAMGIGRRPAMDTTSQPSAPDVTDSPRTILVTSSSPGEGKTTVVANLAASYAQMGRKVLVLSCDFRNPRIHKLFDVPNESGLSEALVSKNGKPVLEGHLLKTMIHEGNLRIVPSGSAPESPGELLSSGGMQEALLEARQMADIVLLDSPPLLTASDASSLFPDVDAVLVVARAGRTKFLHAERASELLHTLDAPVRGVVLNDVSENVPRRFYPDENNYADERRGFSRLVRH